jgi:hypothetical protein
MILAFFVVHCFVAVFEMAVDSIFICYCVDRRENDGMSSPYYMSPKLQKAMDGYSNFKNDEDGESDSNPEEMGMIEPNDPIKTPDNPYGPQPYAPSPPYGPPSGHQAPYGYQPYPQPPSGQAYPQPLYPQPPYNPQPYPQPPYPPQSSVNNQQPQVNIYPNFPYPPNDTQGNFAPPPIPPFPGYPNQG